MVLRIIEHVKQCFSADDGAVIAQVLHDAFSRGEKVQLSFAGISDVTSSFVNAAVVSQLSTYPADWVKRHLAIRDVSSPSADVIRRCMANGERNMTAA